MIAVASPKGRVPPGRSRQTQGASTVIRSGHTYGQGAGAVPFRGDPVGGQSRAHVGPPLASAGEENLPRFMRPGPFDAMDSYPKGNCSAVGARACGYRPLERAGSARVSAWQVPTAMTGSLLNAPGWLPPPRWKPRTPGS